MNSYRKTAIAIGILYIIGTVSGGASQAVFWEPIHSAQDPLISVSAHGTQVILGAIFWLTMGLALAMVPVLAFSVLRKHNEPFALGYVVFRGGLETVIYIGMSVGWLLLLPLSTIYTAGASNAAVVGALGGSLLESRGISSIGTIVFCLGALMFYWVLFRSKLVPRWLSGWGLIAAVPYIAGGVLGLVDAVDPWANIVTFMDIPLAVQEMVLAVWLIVKGFNPSATIAGAGANTPPNTSLEV
jgi:hypothetical protein